MPGPDVMAYHPDMKDMPEEEKRKGLFCFINPSRICGADCMAFQTAPPPGQDYVAQQWAQCSLLVNMHKLGKHSGIIATELVKKNRDSERTAQPPAPVPTMPKRPGT